MQAACVATFYCIIRQDNRIAACSGILAITHAVLELQNFSIGVSIIFCVQHGMQGGIMICILKVALCVQRR